MSEHRSITASDAKARLGEALASLSAEGPIEITRHGRVIGVLTAPENAAPTPSSAKLAQLAALYASGVVSWRQVAQDTGASFGELLLELARQQLRLPEVKAKKRPEQLEAFNQAMRQARQSS